MFLVSEEDAAAIRVAYERDGEFAAAVELRRRFPGIADNDQARQCARTIAGWSSGPLPQQPVVKPLRLKRRFQLPTSSASEASAPPPDDT